MQKCILIAACFFCCGISFSQPAQLSATFSGDPLADDLSGKLIASGSGGFYFFSHRNSTFVSGEFDAQGDTIYTRTPLPSGFIISDMEVDPLGYLLYAGSYNSGGWIYRSNFSNDSVSMHASTGMENVIETVIVNDTLLAGVGYSIPPDFPLHCCVPYFALYHRDGTRLNVMVNSNYGRINDLLLVPGNQLVAAGAHITGYPDGYIALYDVFNPQLTEINIATPEPFSIDYSSGQLAIGGYMMNNSLSERYDLVQQADSFYVYNGTEFHGREILFSSYGNTLTAGIRSNVSGDDSLMLRCINNRGEIEWDLPLFTGEISAISDFVSTGNGWYALFATAINENNGSYDNLLLRFYVEEEAPDTDELPMEMRVRPTVFQDELLFEGLQLVPELIDELNIFDMSGRPVNYHYDLQPGRFTLRFPDIANGTYIYHVVHNGYTYSGKLIRFKPE